MTNEMLKKSLDPGCIILELQSRSRNDAIKELLTLLYSRHNLNNFEEVLKIVIERERKMSTSLENEAAVPHGKTDIVNQTFCAIGLKKKGIDFKSVDGRPSKIIALLVSPLSTTGPHVRCLAEIAKLLHPESNRKKILEAKSSEEVYRIFTTGE